MTIASILTKELIKIAGASLGVLLLLPIVFDGLRNLHEYSEDVGIYAFGLGFLWILIGFILNLMPATRKFGRAFLLTAMIMLAIGFIFCPKNIG